MPTAEQTFEEIVAGLTASPVVASPLTVEEVPLLTSGCESCNNGAHGSCNYKYDSDGKRYCCCGAQSW
jgi:hypothetical protein